MAGGRIDGNDNLPVEVGKEKAYNDVPVMRKARPASPQTKGNFKRVLSPPALSRNSMPNRLYVFCHSEENARDPNMRSFALWTASRSHVKRAQRAMNR